MSQEIHYLEINVHDDCDICITPDESMPDSLWSQVVNYWSPGDLLALRSKIIKITGSRFVEKKQWLRDGWTRRDYKVVIGPGVKEMDRSLEDGVENFEKLRLINPESEVLRPVQLTDLSRSLTKEQQENVSRLLRMKHGANFSVPGAGKTMTALVVWRVLQADGTVNKLLVVCPLSAFSSWEFELLDCFDHEIKLERYSGSFIAPDTEVVITNYEQLENPEKLSYLQTWCARNQTHLVIDEAHRVKAGGRSIRWRSCQKLSKSSQRTDVMTGTPMPQGISDLEAIYGLAWSSLPKRNLNQRTLNSMKRNTTFVRTTKSELNLPAVSNLIYAQEPSLLQSEIYSALKDQYSGVFGLKGYESSFLAKRGKAVMSLIAAATNPGLLFAPSMQEVGLGIEWPPREIRSNHHLVELIENYLAHELPWKFTYAIARSKEAAEKNQKLLIWSSFVGNLLALNRLLKPFNPALVYGGVSTEDRASEKKRFREDSNCTVLLTNPQTLGEGISFHKECHSAIYIDRTYDAGLYLQSLDRIHRLGLDQDTLTDITVLKTIGTIDERIDQRLEEKITKLGTFLDDSGLIVTAIPQIDEVESNSFSGIEDDDMADILSHLRSEV